MFRVEHVGCAEFQTWGFLKRVGFIGFKAPSLIKSKRGGIMFRGFLREGGS